MRISHCRKIPKFIFLREIVRESTKRVWAKIYSRSLSFSINMRWVYSNTNCSGARRCRGDGLWEPKSWLRLGSLANSNFRALFSICHERERKRGREGWEIEKPSRRYSDRGNTVAASILDIYTYSWNRLWLPSSVCAYICIYIYS